MSGTDRPASWTDPSYVATVVAVLATGALYFYAGLTDGGPTPGEITLVVLVVTVPAGIAYEVARRWGG